MRRHVFAPPLSPAAPHACSERVWATRKSVLSRSRCPGCAQVCNTVRLLAVAPSRLFRRCAVDLLPYLRRRSLDVQDRTPGHKDGGVRQVALNLDPQLSVIFQKKRGGYGFRPVPDRLGGLLGVQVGARDVRDENSIPDPLRDYRGLLLGVPCVCHRLVRPLGPHGLGGDLLLGLRARVVGSGTAHRQQRPHLHLLLAQDLAREARLSQ
jgi:hypothetical protein